MSDDTDLNDSLRFLREREIIHSQRFREAVEILKNERGKRRYFNDTRVQYSSNHYSNRLL